MEISVEIKSPYLDEFTTHEANLRDSIISFTSEYTAESLQGVDGKRRLKSDLRRRLNDVLPTAQVSNLFFTNFVHL